MPFIIHQYQHRSIYLGDFFILCFHPDKIFWKINHYWPHILTCQHMWLHMSLSGLDTMCKIFLKLLYGQLGHFVRNLLRNVITHFGILGRQHKTCNNFEEHKKHVWQQMPPWTIFLAISVLHWSCTPMQLSCCSWSHMWTSPQTHLYVYTGCSPFPSMESRH